MNLSADCSVTQQACYKENRPRHIKTVNRSSFNHHSTVNQTSITHHSTKGSTNNYSSKHNTNSESSDYDSRDKYDVDQCFLKNVQWNKEICRPLQNPWQLRIIYFLRLNQEILWFGPSKRWGESWNRLMKGLERMNIHYKWPILK